MKNNKKGFTLTELLAVITILGIIITIAVVSFANIRTEINETQYENLASTIKTAARGYVEETGIKKMFVQTLIDEGLIEADDETKILHDPRNNASLNCQVITFDNGEITISEEENPSCDVTILNDVAIKIQYVNDYGIKEDLKENSWFNKSITLSVASTGAVPIDLSEATYTWSSPLAPDTSYTGAEYTIDNQYVEDTYQVVVSIKDERYVAYADVKIDRTSPRVSNIVDINPSNFTTNKEFQFILTDTGSGIDGWQVSFDKYNEPTSWNKIENTGSKKETIKTNIDLSRIREGESFYIWVKDVVGNTNGPQLENSSDGGYVVNSLDSEIDVVELTGNPGPDVYANKITLTGKLQDTKSGLTNYICSKTSYAPLSGWQSVTITNDLINVNCPDNLVDSNGDYYIYAKDATNNISSAKYTVSNYDKVIDTIAVRDLNSGYRESTTLKGTATDNAAGIVAYSFTNSTAVPGSWTNVAKTNSLDINFTANENKAYYFHVKDAAGNTSYKQVNVSNIVVKRSLSDTISGKNSTVTKNYTLAGAVQIINVTTDTGTARGSLYGTSASVSASGGKTYTENVPSTCTKNATTSAAKATTNCTSYSCSHGGYPNSSGMCTGSGEWVPSFGTEDNSWVCWYCPPEGGMCSFDESIRYSRYICSRWDSQISPYCTDSYLKGTQWSSDLKNKTWKKSSECYPPDYGTGTGCSVTHLAWHGNGDCMNYYEWDGNYRATCTSSKQTYSCPSGQKMVGTTCYSCAAGQTLTASNTCQYDCSTTSNYWKYNITINYYVLK